MLAVNEKLSLLACVNGDGTDMSPSNFYSKIKDKTPNVHKFNCYFNSKSYLNAGIIFNLRKALDRCIEETEN